MQDADGEYFKMLQSLGVAHSLRISTTNSISEVYTHTVPIVTYCDPPFLCVDLLTIVT